MLKRIMPEVPLGDPQKIHIGVGKFLLKHLPGVHQHTKDSESPDSLPPWMPNEWKRFITPEQLIMNRQAYPDLIEKLTPEEEKHMEMIREAMMQLPIFHCSYRPKISEIKPAIQLSTQAYTHTYPFDRSLGLDRFIFMSWGDPKWAGFGPNMHRINPHILFDPATVVTPLDINACGGEQNRTYDQIPDDQKQKIKDEYFGKMLSGEDWFEYRCRRALKSLKWRPLIPIDVNGGTSSGEVKFHGTVPKKYLMDGPIIGREGMEREYYPYLYSHGFCIPNLEAVRESVLKNRPRVLTDPTPEEMGIDYDKAIHYWDSIRSNN